MAQRNRLALSSVLHPDDCTQSLWCNAGPPRGQLRGIDHDCNDIPDAAMTLAVAALFAEVRAEGDSSMANSALHGGTRCGLRGTAAWQTAPCMVERGLPHRCTGAACGPHGLHQDEVPFAAVAQAKPCHSCQGAVLLMHSMCTVCSSCASVGQGRPIRLASALAASLQPAIIAALRIPGRLQLSACSCGLQQQGQGPPSAIVSLLQMHWTLGSGFAIGLVP